MPYKRKYVRRKNKRKPQRKQPKLKTLERRVRKLEHSEELKYKDVYSTTLPTTTFQFLSMNLIGQGDDAFNNRIGEEISAKYLNMKLRFIHPAGTTSDAIRCVVFWDKQANGAAPDALTSTNAATAVWDNTTVSGGSTIVPYNYRAKQRYKVLYDRIITLEPESSTTEKVRFVRHNFRLNGAKIKYSDSGTTQASITSRNLIFAYSCISGSGVTCALSFRLWYTDA